MKNEIDNEIDKLNAELYDLEERRDELIKRKFEIEREEQRKENDAWTKRVIEARRGEQKRYKGRHDAKYSKLNFFKRKRKERKENLNG